jgi:hypothetical protein
MNWLTNVMKVVGPRLIGAAAAGAAGVIYAKTKGAVTVDPTQVAEIVTTMIGTYAVAHRTVTAISPNPGDAATGRVAAGENAAANNPMAGDTVVIPPK